MSQYCYFISQNHTQHRFDDHDALYDGNSFLTIITLFSTTFAIPFLLHISKTGLDEDREDNNNNNLRWMMRDFK